MSFFVRQNRKRNHLTLSKPTRKALENDEIESSDDDDESKETGKQKSDEQIDEEDEDADETVQEKRFRLAKQYLAEIEKQEQEKNDVEEFKNEAIAHRLRNDLLEQSGKLQRNIAEQLLPPNVCNIRCLRGHKLSPTCIVVANNGKKIASGSKDGSLIVWDFCSGKKLSVIKPILKSNGTVQNSSGHFGQIRSLALSSDDKYLCSGGSDKRICVWEFDSMTQVKVFTGHTGTVTGLIFRRGFHQLYSCSEDRSVKVWNLDEMGYVDTMFGHHDQVLDIDCLSKERAITCGGRDRTVRIWKLVEQSQLVFNALAGCGSVECLSLLNEDHFVTGADDGSLCVWSVLRKKPVCSQLKAHAMENSSEPCWISAVCAAKFTDLIASGSRDGVVKLWRCSENYKSLLLLHSLSVTGFINSISFTPTIEHLLCAVGQEHKSGRWWREKNAKNSIVLCPLEKRVLY